MWLRQNGQTIAIHSRKLTLIMNSGLSFMAFRSVYQLISEEEYLRSSYEHDCDYVDGNLENRAGGEFDHSFIQGFLIALFWGHERIWGILTLPEQRVQVSPTRYRVPDVCVLRRGQPREPIVRQAPLICIEILSPEDSMSRVQTRIDDFVRMGVPNVWVIDPSNRTGLVCTAAGLNHPVDGIFAVEGTDIRVPLSEIFAKLDEP